MGNCKKCMMFHPSGPGILRYQRAGIGANTTILSVVDAARQAGQANNAQVPTGPFSGSGTSQQPFDFTHRLWSRTQRQGQNDWCCLFGLCFPPPLGEWAPFATPHFHFGSVKQISAGPTSPRGRHR
jgi:hypothetical protein